MLYPSHALQSSHVECVTCRHSWAYVLSTLYICYGNTLGPTLTPEWKMPLAGASDKIGRGKDDSAAKPSCSLQTIPANNSHVGARVDIFGKEKCSLALSGHDAEVTTSWTAYDSPRKFVTSFVTE